MARARIIAGDMNSAEFDHLRRTVNTLILMLESAEASLTAGATAENILDAWADAARTGLDDNSESIANITATNRALEGLKASPKHPDRPKGATKDMDANSDF